MMGNDAIATTDIPSDNESLAQALVAQREYTLALYADLPAAYWNPAEFPYSPTINPPLWELAHIGWFAEFFCLRWRADDSVRKLRLPSLAQADALFNSGVVPHRDRWTNNYPDKRTCFDYLRRSLDDVLTALRQADDQQRYFFQLALGHEDMHDEALLITRNTLGLSLPASLRPAPPVMAQPAAAPDLAFAGGPLLLGASARAFRFDNECPAMAVEVAPFSIAAAPHSAAEFARFADSAAYDDPAHWSAAGLDWKRGTAGRRRAVAAAPSGAAMHLNHFEAEAWCHWAGRRLPTEAEWEFAATRSAAFADSTGRVWEWTASPFNPFPGFAPGPYRDYSVPWFGDHMVLKGGSFATHPRLRYPQYRNFYLPWRSDLFCGVRTCART